MFDEELTGRDYAAATPPMSIERAVFYCVFRPGDGVVCDDNYEKCETCGWHPRVEKERKEKIRKEFAAHVCGSELQKEER